MVISSWKEKYGIRYIISTTIQCICEISIELPHRPANDIRTEELKVSDRENIIKSFENSVNEDFVKWMIEATCYVKEFYTNTHLKGLTQKKLNVLAQSMNVRGCSYGIQVQHTMAPSEAFSV